MRICTFTFSTRYFYKDKLMYKKVGIVLLLLLIMQSCEYFITPKPAPILIDFSKVDSSPSFEECKLLIDDERTQCFRNTIHKKLTTALTKHSLTVKQAVNETVQLQLIISAKGEITVKDLTLSKQLTAEIPKIDSLLRSNVDNLPKVSPAKKQGIPVATQYTMLIKIMVD